MQKQFTNKIISLVLSLLILFIASISLFNLISRRLVFAGGGGIYMNIGFNKLTNNFDLRAQSTFPFNYLLNYKTPNTIEGITGGPIDSPVNNGIIDYQRAVFAGTCSSGGTCTFHQVLRGIYKTKSTISDYVESIRFIINNGILSVYSNYINFSGQLELNPDELYWLNYGIEINPTPIPTTKPTSTPLPTSIPTPTPSPTPTPVSFTTVGFADIDPINVTIQAGSTSYTPIFKLMPTTATAFTFYGYPTTYGPGISFNPVSGGISSFGSTILLYVNGNVPVGTYSGYQRLIASDMSVYALIPVTVTVTDKVMATPTPTPIPTINPTNTPRPTPTPTLVPTPTPTSQPILFSNISAGGTSKSTELISWNTFPAGTTQVAYGNSIILNKVTVEDKIFSTFHTVTLSNLQKNTKYYYQVISRDAFGTRYVSAINTFTTLKK